ncbi:MAG: hypothetical protein ACE369_04700 [Roseovarius sp.]
MKSRWMEKRGGKIACVVGLSLICADPALATERRADSWTLQKCVLYESSVRDAISLQGPEGLRVEFLTENQKFIDAGCAGRAEICPMTQEEWSLADLLLKMTMNEGMASTFVPFGCS